MPSPFLGDYQYVDVKTRRLARAALKAKWGMPQRTNYNMLATMCPFCADAWRNGGTCVDCVAPPQLCADYGRGGLVGQLIARHGDAVLARLPPVEFNLVRNQLVELANEGLAAACLRATTPAVAETVPPLSRL